MATVEKAIPLDAVCKCGHRAFEHCHDGCAVRQMYGGRYRCDCERFDGGDGVRTE